MIDSVISKTKLSPESLVLSQENDVIIPSSGETQEDIATSSCVIESGIALGGDINIIRSNINGVFLSYYLNNAKKIEIARLAQGISVVHLYSSQLEKLDIEIPKPKEQQKIAACLTSLDDLIQAQSEKLDALKDHKKGLLQQLFPGEGERAPKLRFREFEGNGEWVEKTIGSVFQSFSGGTPSTINNKYYGGEIPFIRSAEIGKKTTELFLTQAGYKNSSAKMVNKGDVLYALYGANSGDVSLSKLDGAINQAILCLKSEYSNEFLYHFLTYKKNQIIDRYIQGGQGNLSGEIVKSISLYFPMPEEQQKIANCLTSLNNLIQTQAKKIDVLKDHKKGLMQQLFPNLNEQP